MRRIEIRVLPRARKNCVEGFRNGRLIVRTTAPPVDDAANHAAVELLAEHFEVPARCVRIIRGQHQRDKTVEIDD